MKAENREDKIQKLLRHAFACLCNQGCTFCSCAKNIQDFLSTDRISLKWREGVRRIKELPAEGKE